MFRLSCFWYGHDQTQVSSKRLWSDSSALKAQIHYDQTLQTKLTSNHTISRPWPRMLVRWNFRPDPVISVWEHTDVRSTGSDHKSIWIWTSIWVQLCTFLFILFFIGLLPSESLGIPCIDNKKVTYKQHLLKTTVNILTSCKPKYQVI